MTTIISVRDGKFHHMVGEPTRANAFRSAETACGRTVEPRNYFADKAAADSYTGGHLAHFLCKHCAGKD